MILSGIQCDRRDGAFKVTKTIRRRRNDTFLLPSILIRLVLKRESNIPCQAISKYSELSLFLVDKFFARELQSFLVGERESEEAIKMQLWRQR